MYIKDLGSSNGTFVNGKRLSEEGVASSPRELANSDILEFGVDIWDEEGSKSTLGPGGGLRTHPTRSL